MACYKPLQAYRTESGAIEFCDKGNESISLPCGQCVGCRLERSRQWAIRCVHEAQLYEKNCFVTLTYKDSPVSLVYRDFQLFMKRLRKKWGAIRFYMCGEYGELNARPHFHACLFGFDFPDKLFFRNANGGSKLYTSVMLDELWGKGLCSVGDVTFESAAYVARYVMKKITGDAAVGHYRVVDAGTGEIVDRVPEFNHMSLRPGIGRGWYDKWRSDVYPEGGVVIRGKLVKPPKYYDNLEERLQVEDFEQLVYSRYKVSRLQASDNTDERLRVREVVAKARVNLFNREI